MKISPFCLLLSEWVKLRQSAFLNSTSCADRGYSITTISILLLYIGVWLYTPSGTSSNIKTSRPPRFRGGGQRSRQRRLYKGLILALKRTTSSEMYSLNLSTHTPDSMTFNKSSPKMPWLCKGTGENIRVIGLIIHETPCFWTALIGPSERKWGQKYSKKKRQSHGLFVTYSTNHPFTPPPAKKTVSPI